MNFASRQERTYLFACAPALQLQREHNEHSTDEAADRHTRLALCPLRQSAGNRRSNVPMHTMLGAAGGRLSGMGIGAAGVRVAIERNLARAARILAAGK